MRFDSYKTGEVTLARELWAEVPNDSVIIVDRNFVVAADPTKLQGDGTNRQWLTRAQSTAKLRTIERLDGDDELVEINWEHPLAGTIPICPSNGSPALFGTSERASAPPRC
jgi:hypothetical protein